MSFVLGVFLAIVGLLFAIVLWKSLPTDRIGRLPRVRRRTIGFQGQLTEWLYWDAPLQPPTLENLGASDGNIAHVGNRALLAIVRRVAIERNLDLDTAHKRLLEDIRAPHARAFLQGKMRRAIRLHWRRRYRGPDLLFHPWYYLVAVVRYGKRHLYLDTLSAILEELHNP